MLLLDNTRLGSGNTISQYPITDYFFFLKQHILLNWTPCTVLPVRKAIEHLLYLWTALHHRYTHFLPSCLSHLLGCSRLPFEDGFRCFVVLMSHGAGKWRRALTVSQVQTDVWVRDEKLDNHVVLVTDGHVDWCPALGILRVTAERQHREWEESHSIRIFTRY